MNNPIKELDLLVLQKKSIARYIKKVFNVFKFETVTINKMKILGSTINIIDYKVNGPRDREDQMYVSNKDLWQYLPRCFASIHVEKQLIKIISGLRKFESDEDFKLTLKKNEVITKEVYINKLNGEYCGLSSFELNRQIYFVVRSKNVTIVMRENNFIDDLTKLYNGRRYEYVVEMANIFWNKYNTFDVAQKQKYIEYTLKNTINCELISPSHQHLVDYNGESKLMPYISSRYQDITNGLTEIPNIFFENINTLNFDKPNHIDVDVLDNASRMQIREQIYTEDNSEGAVVYIVAKNIMGIERVVQVYKFKNYKYVFWRAVREKMREKASIEKLKNRLNNLHCVVPNKEALIEEAIKFYAYCWKTEDRQMWERWFKFWINKLNEYHKIPKEEIEKCYEEFVEYDKNKSK